LQYFFSLAIFSIEDHVITKELNPPPPNQLVENFFSFFDVKRVLFTLIGNFNVVISNYLFSLSFVTIKVQVDHSIGHYNLIQVAN
jgi:hypothetical protein